MRRSRGGFGNAELSLIPDRGAIGQEARCHLVRTVLPGGGITPTAAFSVLRGRGGGAFLFESLGKYDARNRWTFVGIGGVPVVEWRVGEPGNAYEMVRAALAARSGEAFDDAPPLISGLVGFFSYESAHLIEPTVPVIRPAEEFPDALFLRCAAIVAFDHQLDRIHVLAEVAAEGEAEAAYDHAAAAIHEVVARLEAATVVEVRAIQHGAPVALRPVRPADEFEAAVRKAREYIEAGDCQQIVLSQRFTAELSIDPFAVYLELRDLNPSPYLFFLEHDGRALVGSSPEALTRIRNREIVVRPIAGTRARGRDAADDARISNELLADAKENAEHTMLVDLARNDIGRVARIGSVRVEVFRTVELYSHVMHIVSQVKGELADGIDTVAALQSVFPAGTVSGAPKVRAMQIIAELEPTRRGPYAGCVGYIGDDGSLDMAIVIRTVVCTPGRLMVQAGAGVVYDSDPASEQRETVQKASALFSAVERAQGAGA